MPTVVVIRRVDTGRIEVEVVRVISTRGGRRPELAVDAQIAEVWSTNRAVIKIETPVAHDTPYTHQAPKVLPQTLEVRHTISHLGETLY